jgi:hypothetical protein
LLVPLDRTQRRHQPMLTLGNNRLCGYLGGHQTAYWAEPALFIGGGSSTVVSPIRHAARERPRGARALDWPHSHQQGAS